MNKNQKSKESDSTADDAEIHSELRAAYKVILKTRETPEYRKGRHIVEQKILLKMRTLNLEKKSK